MPNICTIAFDILTLQYHTIITVIAYIKSEYWFRKLEWIIKIWLRTFKYDFPVFIKLRCIILHIWGNTFSYISVLYILCAVFVYNFLPKIIVLYVKRFSNTAALTSQKYFMANECNCSKP